ncbi:putative transcriptional regulator [Actinoalloteichus hymeniacidonis]|uniref:Transcriptional regulator n=1 Tax=Actinoalloteichus hymeniacidonis TaxID=340345 RepID=A0AAC9HQ96_9PSEU|nr:putative transcriptional regulator [Actinoalloteichus hymeniacidonis]
MLRLLSLLLTGRTWTGPVLAEHLGVTDRTVRRDIERLRDLDYPVGAVSGTAGGYRLIAGRHLPPLLLDDDEAVAVAVGLRTATDGIPGFEEVSARALAKLDRVLPARLRPRVAALATTVVPVGRRHPTIDTATLGVLADTCRDQEILSFDYRRRDGSTGLRRVEPHRLISSHGLWYLLGFDTDRQAWRTFRVDRLTDPRPSGRKAPIRTLPTDDAAEYLARAITSTGYRHTAQVTVAAQASDIHTRLPTAIAHRVTPLSETHCLVRLSADSLDTIAQDLVALIGLDQKATVTASPEVVEHLRTVGERLSAITGTAHGITPTPGLAVPDGLSPAETRAQRRNTSKPADPGCAENPASANPVPTSDSSTGHRSNDSTSSRTVSRASDTV